jgi:hypothetical protein
VKDLLKAYSAIKSRLKKYMPDLNAPFLLTDLPGGSLMIKLNAMSRFLKLKD